MSLKKSILVFGLVTGVILTGFIISEFTPRRVIENPEKVSLEWLVYEGEEIASDENAVLEILEKYDARKSMKNFFPTQTEEMKFQMTLTDGEKLKHIILGEPDIWYEGENRRGHVIMNADELVKELEILFSR